MTQQIKGNTMITRYTSWERLEEDEEGELVYYETHLGIVKN